MELLDDWHDYWRLLNGMLGFVGFVLLFYRYVTREASWKLLFSLLWFSCLIFSLTGLVSSVEGIFLDIPLGIRIPLVTVAATASVIAGVLKGLWADEDLLRAKSA